MSTPSGSSRAVGEKRRPARSARAGARCRSSSRASSRTAPSPSQRSSASASCSASRCVPENLQHRRRPVRALDPNDVAADARNVRLAEAQFPALAAVRDKLADVRAPLRDLCELVGHRRSGIVIGAATLWRVLGVWRSLVARSVRVGDGPSSNLESAPRSQPTRAAACCEPKP